MRRKAVVACVGAGLVLSAACSREDRDEARARAERMEQRTKEGAQRLADKTKEAASNLSEKTKSAMNDHGPTEESAEDKLRKGAENVKAAGRKAGVELREGAITAKVKARLAAEVGLNSATAVNVDTVGHTVTLRGQVESEQKRREVEKAALTVDGVTKVNNELRVR